MPPENVGFPSKEECDRLYQLFEDQVKAKRPRLIFRALLDAREKGISNKKLPETAGLVKNEETHALITESTASREVQELKKKLAEFRCPYVVKVVGIPHRLKFQTRETQEPNQPEIEAFFGRGASTHEGVIIVQSDPIEAIVAPLVEPLINAAFARLMKQRGKPANRVVPTNPVRYTREEAEALVTQTITPTTRFYKARTWVNKWDTEGAQEIREKLSGDNVKTPRIFLREDSSPAKAPFQIAMGLGYTDLTRSLLDNPDDENTFSPWVRISKERESGDTICFHQKLKPSKFADLSYNDDCEHEGFFRVLPNRWKGHKDYLDRWLNMRHPRHISDVSDYATILRYTRADGTIVFILAGFTERATAAAGHYLAYKWRELYAEYVDPNNRKVDVKGLGDFLVVIQGPSWSTNFDSWKEDASFPGITPKRLFDAEIPCEWQSRIGDLPEQPPEATKSRSPPRLSRRRARK